jgi:hypothetical protein
MIWLISYAVMALIAMSVMFILCARWELREKKWRMSGQCDGLSLGDLDPTMCLLCIMLGVVWPISLALFLVFLFIRAWIEFIIIPTVNKLEKHRERKKNDG